VMAALSGWVATPIPPPAEREMPTLSPAVAGGAGGMRASAPAPSLAGASFGGGLRTVPSAGGTTFSGMPTQVATVSTPAPVTTPAPHSANAPAVWSTLDADTQSVARGDTAKPKPVEELPDEDEERPSRVKR